MARDLYLRVVAALLTAIFANGCSNNSSSPAPPPSTGGSPPLMLSPFVSGLTSPIDAQFPNDGTGRFFVVQQPGSIRVGMNAALLATPFLDISSKVRFSGEMGLLGLAFHPQFTQN